MAKELKVIGYSLVAGLNAVCAVERVVDYCTQRAIVLQEHLSRAPELTDKVFEAANEAANNTVGIGSAVWGLGCGAIAGLLAGVALYEAGKKGE